MRFLQDPAKILQDSCNIFTRFSEISIRFLQDHKMVLDVDLTYMEDLHKIDNNLW